MQHTQSLITITKTSDCEMSEGEGDASRILIALSISKQYLEI